MSRQELHRRLKAVDPNLTIISGKKHPYILKPDEARGRGLPDLPGRTPPAEILELEGQYSLKALRAMASENNLSPEGDKEMLVRRLLKKGVLQIAGGQGILMQTEPIWATTISKYIDHLQLLYKRALDEFYRQQKLIEKAIKEREEGLKKTLPQFTIGELRRALNASRSFYGPSTIPKGKWQLAKAERMPRINPHASALKQDEQLRRQMNWLKQHGFKTARDAQEAGY